MNFDKIIDVTRRVYPGMAVWPGDEGVIIETRSSMKKGDKCNVTSIKFGMHTGTHVDAPLHFVDGSTTVDALDLSKFIGYVKVFDLKVEKCITADDIRNLPINEGDMVFFKTPNSLIPDDGVFYRDFIYLDLSAAGYLVDRNVKTIGVDYLSVEKFNSPDSEVHKLLLSNKVGVIEGLYLKEVAEGEYFFSCLPLNVVGVEGSPARAVLVEVK